MRVPGGDGRTKDHGNVVELDIPAGADLLVLARLTAATVASRTGFNVEEIEDLRLAVDELCLPLVRAAPAGRLRLSYLSLDDAIEITCAISAGGDDIASGKAGEGAAAANGPHPGDELSARILDALVDHHGRAGTGHESRLWLRKQRANATA